MRWIIAALIVLAASIEAKAQTTVIYGPQGQYLGTVQTVGPTTQFYGPQGQWAGTANTFGTPAPVFVPPTYAPLPTFPVLPTWGMRW